jgi:nucleoside-diphosphate-sugar epimerase
MRIFITGIGGFLGSNLAEHWRSEGHDASGTRHRLGDSIPVAMFEGQDIVIHCAHDFSPGAGQRNHEGTLAMFHTAKAAGVKRQIYISSYSARPDSRSRYGATKYAVEQDILAGGGVIVRPGLVAGPGGMFGRLAHDLQRRSFTPLVHPDRKTVAVIGLPDLLAAFTALLEPTERRAWNLFSTPLISPREFVEAIWRSSGRSGRIFSVPPWLAFVALHLASPSLADSLRGQLANQQPLHQSDLDLLVVYSTDPIAAVEAGVRA